MKKFVLLILFLFSTTLLGADVIIKIDPERPVAGDVYNVRFTITSDSSEEPNISFNPLGAEVIGRANSSLSSKTTYMNGKLSVERKFTIDYELLSNNAGEAFLRDIKIEVGDKVITHPTVRISIYRDAPTNPNLFVKAEVSSTEVYEKESILVRYFIYSKFNLSNFEIKKFPQLNKFLIRYHDEKRGVERVEYNGQLYLRKLVYTVQLFAESAATYTVDPISLIIYYSVRGNDPFAGIGFGMSNLKKSSFSSAPVKIKVKQLPVENVPSSFTGLVGKHEFELKVNKSKFLVNEPIELKFNVKGPGALELFESPQLLNDGNLEAFDSSADLKIDQNFVGIKSFDMTYLGRGPVDLTARKIPMTYFDPQLEKFVTVELDFNGVKVAGAAVATPKKVTEVESKKEKTKPVIEDVEKRSFVPLYSLVNTYRYHAKNITAILGMFLLFIVGFKFKSYLANRGVPLPNAIENLKKKGVNYSNLYSVIFLMRDSNETDIKKVIEYSSLSQNAKEYFLNLLDECEKEFQKNQEQSVGKIDKKYLSEIEKLLRSKNDCIS